MNLYSDDSNTDYPRLEKVLSHLQNPHNLVSSSNTNFSVQLENSQVDMIRDLVFRSHHGVLRKSGGFYIEEHLAEIAEIGEKLELPHCAIAMFLLHDYIEDHSSSLHYSQGNQGYLMERNYGTLEQQILNIGLSEKDEQVILTGCSSLTKPSEEELNSSTGDSLYTPYEYKLLKTLGYIDESNSLSNQFYAQIGGLLDMYSNADPHESPRDELSQSEKNKFMNNLPRNTQRLMHWAPLIDKEIRNGIYTDPQGCIMNTNAYDYFLQEQLIPRIEEGRKKFSIADDSLMAKNYSIFRSTQLVAQQNRNK